MDLDITGLTLGELIEQAKNLNPDGYLDMEVMSACDCKSYLPIIIVSVNDGDLQLNALDKTDKTIMYHVMMKSFGELDRPYKALRTYLTSSYGLDLVIKPDGKWYSISYSRTNENDDEGTVRVRCPGVENIDSTDFTEDFVERREDGVYYELETGRKVGDLVDVIDECIEDGDVEKFLDNLKSEIFRAREEDCKTRYMFEGSV